MGEGLPFWIDRVDNRTACIQTGPGLKPRTPRKRPSDYLRENFYVTTSGMDFEPALMLAHQRSWGPTESCSRSTIRSRTAPIPFA
jgi:2,3-dihydroxybenzoate decarboxylase